MRDETYRLVKAVLLLIALLGVFAIGYRWAENGRYVQYDKRMTYSPDGKEHMLSPPYMVIDTRTGRLSTPTP